LNQPALGQPLSGQVALVTGASRGFGAAVAVELARAGAHVVLIGRTVGGLEETDDRVRAIGGNATIMPLDLSDTEKLATLGPTLFERFGRLDIFVAAAAEIGQLSPVAHADPKMWNRILATNLTANQRLAATLDPLLRNAPSGRAIFITDRTAIEASAYWSAYGVSKAGLEQMVRAWTIEAANTRLKIELFDPGPMSTRLRTKAYPGEASGTQPEPDIAARRLLEQILGSDPIASNPIG
jgi:NAD(P)-dependent dehydrogenase (short-subunit alcohol dehydrogenase family)